MDNDLVKADCKAHLTTVNKILFFAEANLKFASINEKYPHTKHIIGSIILLYANLVRVFQMQEVGGTHRGSHRPFSVLDRLLLTHPVWLQLSLNKDSALYILLREPVGVRTKPVISITWPYRFKGYEYISKLGIHKEILFCFDLSLKSYKHWHRLWHEGEAGAV